METNGYEAKVLALKPTNFSLDVEALKDYVTQKRIEKARREPPLQDCKRKSSDSFDRIG